MGASSSVQALTAESQRRQDASDCAHSYIATRDLLIDVRAHLRYSVPILEQTSKKLALELAKPLDASDIASDADALQEVKRLRELLQHTCGPFVIHQKPEGGMDVKETLALQRQRAQRAHASLGVIRLDYDYPAAPGLCVCHRMC